MDVSAARRWGSVGAGASTAATSRVSSSIDFGGTRRWRGCTPRSVKRRALGNTMRSSEPTLALKARTLSPSDLPTLPRWLANVVRRS